MFVNLSDTTKSIVFYSLALFLMIVTCLFHPVLGDLAVIVAMFTPLAATLLMLLVVTRDGWTRRGWASLGLHRPGLRGWPAGVFIPLAVLGGAYLIVWSTGLADVTQSAELEGVAPWLLPALAFFLIAKHVLTGALSEEIGWRGYLLPRLSSLGQGWALTLTGLMQAVWHLPFILLTPLYHASGEWWIVFPLFLAGATIVGVIAGYLRLVTNSVWPSAILHSAHNVFWALLRMSTVASSPLVTEYLAGESGLFPVVGYAIVVAGIFMWSRRKASLKLVAA